jgi:hypothetical protein
MSSPRPISEVILDQAVEAYERDAWVIGADVLGDRCVVEEDREARVARQ